MQNDSTLMERVVSNMINIINTIILAINTVINAYKAYKDYSKERFSDDER